MERQQHFGQPLVWVAGMSATATIGFEYPLAGVPLALGLAAYAAICSCRPDEVLRGRTLSPWQHRRAALVMGGLILLCAAAFSLTIYGVHLAGQLEHRLQRDAALGYRRGELRMGQVIEACEALACARARIIQMTGAHTLGIARLSGFALHDETIYAWPSPTRPPLPLLAHPLR